MKNVLFAAVLLSTTMLAQQPTFWTEPHPPDTHTHLNGNGHDWDDNDGHNGWGYGHHKDDGCIPPPPCEEPNCPGSAPVPEPTTLILAGIGLAGAALVSRRRRKVEITPQA